MRTPKTILRTTWAMLALAVLCAVVVQIPDARAADPKLFFRSQFALIFDKIYVSSLYGRAQGVAGGARWCEHEIGQDVPIFANEPNREILRLLPIRKIGPEERSALQQYRFWPLACSPVYIPKLTLTMLGWGAPNYIKVEFLPTIHCGEFVAAMKRAIAAGSINDLIVRGSTFEEMEIYNGQYSSSSIDFIANRDKEEPEFFNGLLKLLQNYAMIADCDKSTIEFK
ncbi:MAG: hypothetical protein K0S56_868 [Microvirga sp.]|jgi:hypothetical protein|nr:hypothetical protein [Microvirga sp.]